MRFLTGKSSVGLNLKKKKKKKAGIHKFPFMRYLYGVTVQLDALVTIQLSQASKKQPMIPMASL